MEQEILFAAIIIAAVYTIAIIFLSACIVIKIREQLFINKALILKEYKNHLFSDYSFDKLCGSEKTSKEARAYKEYLEKNLPRGLKKILMPYIEEIIGQKICVIIENIETGHGPYFILQLRGYIFSCVYAGMETVLKDDSGYKGIGHRINYWSNHFEKIFDFTGAVYWYITLTDFVEDKFVGEKLRQMFHIELVSLRDVAKKKLLDFFEASFLKTENEIQRISILERMEESGESISISSLMLEKIKVFLIDTKKKIIEKNDPSKNEKELLEKVFRLSSVYK